MDNVARKNMSEAQLRSYQHRQEEQQRHHSQSLQPEQELEVRS